MNETTSTPFSEYTEVVSRDAVDYNGHMNVGYYLLSFENAARALFRHLDLSEEYRLRTDRAMFALEVHLTFEQEIREGETLSFQSQLLGATNKALHVIHLMYRHDTVSPAATNEVLYVHVNLHTRRVETFPPDVMARVQSLVDAHSALARPEQVGRAIQFRR